ncbi:MAG: hypothetical protein ACRDTZ_22815 [Pseudonocardiaceae bacterium]
MSRELTWPALDPEDRPGDIAEKRQYDALRAARYVAAHAADAEDLGLLLDMIGLREGAAQYLTRLSTCDPKV